MLTFTRKYPFILFLFTAVITGCLYFFTASTRLTWVNYANDSGDFLAAILTSGIPHPTGYPTYMLLAGLFQKPPFGSPYFRAILLSLLPAALSAGLMAVLFQKFFTKPQNKFAALFALFTGLVWGLSPFLWTQATIVEVHGLQSLFILLAIWWLLELSEAPPSLSIWKLAILALFFGFGLGNHITLILFLPAIVIASYAAFHKGTSALSLPPMQPFTKEPQLEN